MSSTILLLPAIFWLFALAACGAGAPVRHLTSDACLLLPGQTTKQEILSYLGPPDFTRNAQEQGETWIYYQANRDFLRRLPYVGERLGEENYDVVTVTFAGEVVRACGYRSLSEQEFEDAGIHAPSES